MLPMDSEGSKTPRKNAGMVLALFLNALCYNFVNSQMMMMMPFAQTILLGLAVVTIVFGGLENSRDMSIPVVSKCF